MRNLVLGSLLLGGLVSCRQSPEAVQNEAVGYAQGTTYQIKYITPAAADWQAQFDSVFQAIDQSMSTYLDTSSISLINRGDTLVPVSEDFLKVLNASLDIAKETEGAFDPTVGPLVQFYGFGKDQQRDVDPEKLDSILKLTGYENISLDNHKVRVPKGFQLDFNAIAQGYTVDVISRYLEERGITRYMVEVGGEVRASGTNIEGQLWRIGIDKPSEEMDLENRFQVIVALNNQALATSGNYRKFWVDEETGLRYSHTIDPKTGMPARNQLLSVSVITQKCMDADAYATALMVMGLEQGKEFVRSKQGLEAYFISAGEDGEWQVFFTDGFANNIID